jgi:hypothetical protein
MTQDERHPAWEAANRLVIQLRDRFKEPIHGSFPCPDCGEEHEGDWRVVDVARPMPPQPPENLTIWPSWSLALAPIGPPHPVREGYYHLSRLDQHMPTGEAQALIDAAFAGIDTRPDHVRNSLRAYLEKELGES